MIRCGSKNGQQQKHVLSKDLSMCSDMLTILGSTFNHVGETYVSTRIFTLTIDMSSVANEDISPNVFPKYKLHKVGIRCYIN